MKQEIFVITPIGKKGTETYQKYDAIFNTMIKPALNSVDPNFVVLRADHIANPGSFIKDILEKLHRAFVVIANLTDLNPNVFYELGVRHTLSKRTIMITENLESLPSDLREYRVIEYKPEITGVEEFKQNLKKCVKQILRNPEHSDNPVQDRLSGIINSGEEILKNEIGMLRGQLASVTSSKVKSKNMIFKHSEDAVSKRIHRVLRILNANIRLYNCEWAVDSEGKKTAYDILDSLQRKESIKTTYKVPNAQGNFRFYFIINENLIDYCLVISVHDYDFDLRVDLADVRVMLHDYQNNGDMNFRFTIATDKDMSAERKIADAFFKKALKNIANPKHYSLQIWDKPELLKMEKTLRLI